jgi:hypothetical protein
MTLNRRDLLKGSAMLGAATFLPSFLTPARAQVAATSKKLVMVLNYGGWDQTYALDPKPGLPLVDAPAGELRTYGGVSIWSDPSRPNVDTFFEKWADRTSIINGVQVRSFVHTDCIKRMLTGSPSETTPDMGAIAAFELAPELPVPYLALGQFSRSGPLAAISGRAGTTNQLQALVDPAAAYFPNDGSLVPDFGLATGDDEDALVRQYLEAGAQRARTTRGQRGYNKKRIDDFIASLDRSETLARFVRDGASLGERGYTVDLAVQIPLAVQALSSGLSHTTMLQSGFPWDTHTANAQQGVFHDALFQSLDALVQQLEDDELLDTTTVMVLSEMGRTPKLNGEEGKDHWPVTSCLLLGAGVRGGTVLGATNDELGARSIDLATGEPDDGGVQLQSANLVAGVLENLGVDPAGYLPGVEAFRGFRS